MKKLIYALLLVLPLEAKQAIYPTIEYPMVLSEVVIKPLPTVFDTVTTSDDILIDRYTISEFKRVMASKETGNLPDPYRVVNSLGYMGKYQFHIKTINGLCKQGYVAHKNINKAQFIASDELQEQVMRALIMHHIDMFVRNDLMQFLDTDINGFTITLEGMLAGAHLVGFRALEHYLYTGSLEPFRFKGRKLYKVDYNGTSVEDYVRLFPAI